MPLVCDPSVLANLARCFDLCIPPGAQLGVSNFILAQILLTQNPAMDVSPNNLVAQSRCYNNCIPPGAQLAVMNWLLCQIALSQLTPGTGTAQVFNGHGAPVGLQAGQNALLPAVYTDLDNGVSYPWDTDNGVWMGP